MSTVGVAGAPVGPAGAARPRRPAHVRAAIVSALAIVIGSLFMAAYMLALGDPVPHRIAAAIVGDGGVRTEVVGEIEQEADRSVDFRTYPSVEAALGAMAHQQVYAVLDSRSPNPELYVASAAGASVARVFADAATTDPRIRIIDTHPLPASDPVGLNVFYLVIAATILGFLTVFQVRTNAPGLPLLGWTAFLLSFALVAALALALLAGPLLHRLPLPVLESWAILALQVITVAAFTSTMAVLIGPWAIVPTYLLFMVLGTTSSGGAVAPPLLPGLLALLSRWLPSGVTVTALRNAVYFHSAQQVRPLAVLAVWAIATLVAMLFVSRRRRASPGIP
ncbi:MAG TPA: hypothetical protein VHV82_04145 [Sporichthyaceae bacterium]|jgi:hypothetical protein|nr:hypothetical protein [Sporichthyaceae bacterium]